MRDVVLIAADVNSDNKLNILDYNLISGCFSQGLPAVSCSTQNKKNTDLNDDGATNNPDINLFLRELLTQHGD